MEEYIMKKDFISEEVLSCSNVISEEVLEENSCSNVGNKMNFVNQYIHVQELDAQKRLIDNILEDYKKEVRRVMTTEGCMTTEDYHYLFALKQVRNYLLNKKTEINHRLCEFRFVRGSVEQVEDYINSFQNDSIQYEEKIREPLNPLLK